MSRVSEVLQQMEAVTTKERMQAIEREVIHEIGIPSLVLMERAAASVVEEIRKRVKKKPCRVLILSGTGNNGADGIAMGRMMAFEGDDVTIYIPGNPEKGTPEWKTQRDICEKSSCRFLEKTEDLRFIRAGHYDIIVDALFGIGLNRPIKGDYYRLIEAVETFKKSDAFVVAVDIPSGINANTGQVILPEEDGDEPCGIAVKADLTVTFGYKKFGLHLYPGAFYAGECVVRSIGIPCRLRPEGVIDSFTREELRPVRSADGNKGSFGKVLVAAGSKNMAGASLLCGEASYRTGAGLVRILTPECNRVIVQNGLPEAILTTYDETLDEETVKEACRWATCIVLGPGLSTSDTAEQLMEMILKNADKPMIIDADGCNLLSKHREWIPYLGRQVILTPHIGEMSRLIGWTISQIKQDPMAALLECVQTYGCFAVQKDARTMVTGPGEETIFVTRYGNDGMGTGGSGDVLSGIIGGYLAQGAGELAPYFGVSLHSRAGDAAAERLGRASVLARDLVSGISEILR